MSDILGTVGVCLAVALAYYSGWLKGRIAGHRAELATLRAWSERSDEMRAELIRAFGERNATGCNSACDAINDQHAVPCPEHVYDTFNDAPEENL